MPEQAIIFMSGMKSIWHRFIEKGIHGFDSRHYYQIIS